MMSQAKWEYLHMHVSACPSTLTRENPKLQAEHWESSGPVQIMFEKQLVTPVHAGKSE